MSIDFYTKSETESKIISDILAQYGNLLLNTKYTFKTNQNSAIVVIQTSQFQNQNHTL